MPSLIRFRATLSRINTKTTDNVEISPLCLLSKMLWGFASHRTWMGITTPLFSVWILSPIFCGPSVSLPMYLASGSAWTFSLSLDSLSSTSMTPLSTVCTPLLMTSRYISSIAAVAFWWVIAMIAPFAFHFAFMIRMWAGALRWQSELLIADTISRSILLCRGTPSSLMKIWHLSVLFDPDIGAGPGPGDALWIWVQGCTVSQLPAAVGVALGLGSCCCSDRCLSCSLGSGFAWWCSWHSSGSPPCTAPACCEAPRHSLSCLAVSFLSSFLAS